MTERMQITKAHRECTHLITGSLQTFPVNNNCENRKRQVHYEAMFKLELPCNWQATLDLLYPTPG